jgi:hypothetical protein
VLRTLGLCSDITLVVRPRFPASYRLDPVFVPLLNYGFEIGLPPYEQFHLFRQYLRFIALFMFSVCAIMIHQHTYHCLNDHALFILFLPAVALHLQVWMRHSHPLVQHLSTSRVSAPCNKTPGYCMSRQWQESGELAIPKTIHCYRHF